MKSEIEGESEVAVFSATRWDRKNSQAPIKSATPCRGAQVVLVPIRLTVLAANSADYNMAPQHLHAMI